MSDPHGAVMTPARATAIGGLLTAIASVSMALYTPAMPALTLALGTTMATIKTSLTAYFAGFALAQLVCGPLSDGYGRRPIAFAFLVLCTLAGLVASFAGTVEVLIAARLVQDHIIVTAIAPGAFQSDMNKAARDHGDAVAKSIPVKRIGSPEDMAGTAIFLASKAGDYVVGDTIAVDGGLVHGDLKTSIDA